ncbi:unnamed protein product [Brassica rapa]|uniref:Uncharacterized protein n=1 Tax=Brassica campestris TaxID=3711 RepID=A0A8D9G0K4_BRACM|nr:unnamed protein product [Brassica rapa]
MTSVAVRQHTQYVCGCPPAHTGCLWLSVCVCGCPPTHTGRRLWLSIGTHISTLVLGLSRLTLPWTVWVILAHVGCLFSTHRDVCGCPSVHISARWYGQYEFVDVHGCLWLSVSTHMTSLAVRVCPCVSVSRHRTSVAYTQDVSGCPSAHT